ncbi:MAG: DUF551 domain-containing protein [Solirubrobacterales bacterium]
MRLAADSLRRRSSAPRSKWILCEVKLPIHGQRVLARYRGVYDCRIVTFWLDVADAWPHFGRHDEADGKGSQPATHWCPIPK